jgi:hypothetical protein
MGLQFSINISAVLFREMLPTRVTHHLSRFPTSWL